MLLPIQILPGKTHFIVVVIQCTLGLSCTYALTKVGPLKKQRHIGST